MRELTAIRCSSCKTQASVIALARYLLVLNNIDESSGLLAAATDLSRRDADAEFVLITPAAAPAFDLLIEPRCSATRLAARRARRAREQLVAAGVNLVASRLGNFDPFRAIDDATRFSQYAAIVIAAPERKLLHFMGCDLTCRIARRFSDIFVIHAFNGSPGTHSQLPFEHGSDATSVQH